jgi:adenylate cyclase
MLVAATAVCALLLTLLLRVTGVLTPLSHQLHDAAIRTTLDASDVDRTVTVVRITEAELARYGVPVPEDTLARLIAAALAAGARVVALDLYRDSIAAGGPLSRLAATTDRIVWAEKLGVSTRDGVGPPRGVGDAATIGFTDAIPDADGVVRRALVVVADDSSAHWSLGWQAARRWLADDDIVERVSTDGEPAFGQLTVRPLRAWGGGYTGADVAGHQLVLHPTVATSGIATASVTDVLRGSVGDLLRGRMVLVGVAAPSVRDDVRLPMPLADPSLAFDPGVYLHAHVARQVVRQSLGTQRSTSMAAWWVEALAIVVSVLLGAWAVWRLQATAILLLVAVAGLLVWWGAASMAWSLGAWLSVAGPLAAWASSMLLGSGWRAVRESRQRRALQRLFSAYTDPRVARALWERRSEVMENGRWRPQRLPVTVLFADLKGYTHASEQADPAALLAWIGQFTDTMTQTIMAHGGAVDDYAGDGIKADFGVPFERTTAAEIRADAIAAVRCAMAMADTLTTLNTQWRGAGQPTVGMRIGIASGPAVAGTIGSDARLKFTVVGDVVNVAARLEGTDAIAHDFTIAPSRILISADTARLVQGELLCDALGEHRVKGREAPVAIYRPRSAALRDPVVQESPVPAEVA